MFYDDGGASLRLAAQIERDSTVHNRRDCKAKIAQIRQRNIRRGEIKKSIDRIAGDIDSAALVHQQKTGPLQQQIQAIDKQETDAIINGRELPADLHDRRRDLRQQVEACNAELETAATRGREQVAMLEAELASPDLSTVA